MTDAAHSQGTSLPGAREVFQILRDGQPRTKAELAAITGLARTTVSSRVDVLLATHLARFAGEAASTGGRPPSTLEYNPLAGVLLTADLGATHATIAITDLDGRILASSSHEIDIRVAPERILDLIAQQGESLLAGLERTSSVGAARGRLIGVGIGVPAPVHHSTGQPISTPFMKSWEHFDIPGYLGRSFDVPVLVDNDVNLLALGEHALRFGHVADLIFVKVATGLGAGIISGGALQRGAQGSAGDIGFSFVPHRQESTRPLDDDRDLGGLASGSAIAAELRSLGVECADTAELLELVRTNEPAAVDAMREAGRDIGEVLASMVNILNPSVIVIGGSIGRASEHLLAGVRETVYRRSIPLATQHLTIAHTVADETAGVRGAAIMVAERLFAPEHFASTLERLAALAG